MCVCGFVVNNGDRDFGLCSRNVDCDFCRIMEGVVFNARMGIIKEEIDMKESHNFSNYFSTITFC